MGEVWTELRRARKNAGLSQQELASRAHTSIPMLSEYERGARDPLKMTVGKLLALADELNTDPLTLIGERRIGK